MPEFKEEFHSLSLVLLVTSVYAEVGAPTSSASQWRAANVALYVNATLFVRVLHMSITPCSNPSLRLGSGTSPAAFVQGLAARVAVTAHNLQQTCSLATCCFECVCKESIIKVLDIRALHMHAFITSDNRRLVFDGHIACHAR